MYQPTANHENDDLPIFSLGIQSDRESLEGIDAVYAWDANWEIEDLSENRLVANGFFLGNDEIRMGRIEVQMRR